MTGPAIRDTGYRGIWFALGQQSAHGDKYSGGLGTYTANHVPMAVYCAAADKTFFIYGGTIKGQHHLLIMVSYYDHKEHRVPAPVLVHDKQGVDDPHDNASLNVAADGHIWIFVSGRGRGRPGFKYRSRQPYQIDEFELIATGELTYPQPWFVPGQGILHLFTKYTNGRELYWETSGDGRTWSAHHQLAGLGGHYQVSGQCQGRVATFFNRHPGGNVDQRTDLYYLQTDDLGRTWTTAAGEPVDVPLRQPHNPALVMDYQAQGKLLYTMDLNFDAAGRPVLLYLTSRHHAPGPQGDPREWVVAHWTGRQWAFYTVTTSDHNYDMGSLYIDGAVWRIIGPTQPGPQPGQTGGEMAVWISTDAGQTWRMERQITSGSRFNHSYARRPLHAHDPFYAFWADGDPFQMSDSRLYFADSTGTRYRQLPD